MAKREWAAQIVLSLDGPVPLQVIRTQAGKVKGEVDIDPEHGLVEVLLVSRSPLALERRVMAMMAALRRIVSGLNIQRRSSKGLIDAR